jgi:hypothetical protein
VFEDVDDTFGIPASIRGAVTRWNLRTREVSRVTTYIVETAGAAVNSVGDVAFLDRQPERLVTLPPTASGRPELTLTPRVDHGAVLLRGGERLQLSLLQPAATEPFGDGAPYASPVAVSDDGARVVGNQFRSAVLWRC